jgi:hypothetical protein
LSSPSRCAVTGLTVYHAAGAVELLKHAEAKGGGKDPGFTFWPRVRTQWRRDPARTETRPLSRQRTHSLDQLRLVVAGSSPSERGTLSLATELVHQRSSVDSLASKVCSTATGPCPL